MAIALAPVPPEEAMARFRAKRPQASLGWTEVWGREHARTFTVAQTVGYDVLGDLQGALDRALASGRTYDQFRAEIVPTLLAKGWWGGDHPQTGLPVGNPRRLRVIYDTNLRTARAAGQWERIQRRKALMPYLRYVAVLDDRTRPAHRAWHGIILPVDHPFWRTHYPPCGWFCRCTVQQLTRSQAEALGGVSPDPDIGPMRIWRRRDDGAELITYDGIDPGFAHNPGLLPAADVSDRARLASGRVAGAPSIDPPDARRAAISAWIADPARTGHIVVGTIPESLATAIGARPTEVRLSAETMAKQDREHPRRGSRPQLTDTDYLLLPDLLAEPGEIIQDRERAAVLVRRFGAWFVAAVKSTQSGQAVFLTSFRRANDEFLDRLRLRSQRGSK